MISSLVSRCARSFKRTGAAELQALHRTDHMYRTIVETAREGIWLCDLNGRTLFTNQRMADMLGYSPEEMLGKPVFAFMESDDDRAEAKQEIGETRIGQREFTYRRKDGSRLWTIIEVSAVQGDDGRSDGMCAMVTDISERKALELELSRQHLHDVLTGLPNRALLDDRLGGAIRRCAREDTAVAVLFLDLDGFKEVNDAYGHRAGDSLLIRVAQLLMNHARATDTVARVGGDEFVIVTEAVADERDIQAFASGLRARVNEPFNIDSQELAVDLSIGIAIGRGDADADSLLRDADLAMYHAKSEGGGRIHVFDHELRARVEHRRRLQTDLARAIDASELRVLYQPVVSLDNERTIGAEALLRWHHPELGVLQPSTFVPLAEQTGLIGRLDEWVLERAGRELEMWTETGLDELTVAVNMSAREFGDESLIDRVAAILRRTGADPSRLVVEITETAVMTNLDASKAILLAMKAMGITIAIDDFGTGLSSLSYLSQLPIDTLKIDRSFVATCDRDDSSRSIVAAVLAMARALGLVTLAEGVERLEQLTSLRALGCDLAQGYRWAPPLGPDEFRRRALEERTNHRSYPPIVAIG